MLRLAGDLDLSSADSVRRGGLLALSTPVESLTVDLADVSFLDAAGLSSLERLHEDGVAGGVAVRFRGVSARHRRIMGFVGLDRKFSFAD